MSTTLGHHQLTQPVVASSCSMRANEHGTFNARSAATDVAWWTKSVHSHGTKPRKFETEPKKTLSKMSYRIET